MSYKLNYHIINIRYADASRYTCVSIVNEDTGEVFTGLARRNKKDAMNIRLATNRATARAVKKAIEADLADCETYIIDNGVEPFAFDN